jgi:trimeric autotransporter adhesin
VKIIKLSALLLGLSLIIAVVLPACSSGTPASTTPASTSKPTTPTDTGPLTLKSIQASPTSTDIRIKSTMQIGVMARYTNDTSLDVTSKCTFKSSDESIATVNTTGLITASIVEGTCTVTVSYTENGATQTATIAVKVHSQFLGNS